MQIGDKLTHFQLKNIDNTIIDTRHFADKYALLIVVTCNHCPYALAYWNRLVKIYNMHEEDSLQIIAINGNNANTYPADSFDNMVTLHAKLKLPFPYLHNPVQDIIYQLGAQRTPEVFLFNNQRELAYSGAIDDNWENENAVLMDYLEDAIEFCLDGLEVDYPHIPAVGCSIKWL